MILKFTEISIQDFVGEALGMSVIDWYNLQSILRSLLCKKCLSSIQTP
jgi:hypothetical protein